ncbi:MAG: capsule assembly Wzi family protein [Dyadobacter fermentans]
MMLRCGIATFQCLGLLLLDPLPAHAQDTPRRTSLPDSAMAYLSLAGYVSTSGRAPFWIQSNQFGMVPKESPAGVIGAGIERFTKPDKRTGKPAQWRVGLGAEALGIVSKNSKIIFPQAYVAVRYRNWELSAGRKKEWFGLADSTLGTGSYAWSTNALPIPKIQLSTRTWIAVPLTGGWLSFQASYGDGWFEKGRPVTSGLKLHQKSLYGRIGKTQSRVKLYGGFNHQAQWGGNSPYNTVDGKMAKGFRNYLNVIFGSPRSNTASHHDNTGRVGNHLGSIDLALELETYPLSVLIYRQNLYEDGSLFWLSNIADGLNGIRIKRKHSYGADFQVNTLVFEYLYTKSQGGPVADDNLPSYKRGKDDYFNNGQVQDGWSYFDRTIGTPFITPTSDTRWNWPNYAHFFTSNNRVAVAHIGLEGTLLRQLKWTGKFSYSNNAGVYDSPFEGNPGQFSAMISLESDPRLLKGFQARLSLATDLGALYPHAVGTAVRLTRFF